jgi:hypothetical protein
MHTRGWIKNMWPRDIELEKLSVVTEGGVTDGPTTQLPL